MSAGRVGKYVYHVKTLSENVAGLARCRALVLADSVAIGMFAGILGYLVGAALGVSVIY